MGVYLTGDIHGNPDRVIEFCRKMALSEEDVVVLLGDVGANYFKGERDRLMKKVMAYMHVTFLCVHGNHEIRPYNIPTYNTKEWNGGLVWYEEDYPNLLFADDGEIFELEGLRCLAIGGAYSVDKFYRLSRGFGWWPDEQPSDEVKAKAEEKVKDNRVDVIFSHTCPYKYEPREMFIAAVDQSTVDDSTERWLDLIEDNVPYVAWYCGHWHTDKVVDKMHFLFNDFVKLGE